MHPEDSSCSSEADLEALLDEILVDAYGEDEQLWAFRQRFEDDIAFPANAFAVGEPLEVLEVDYDGNERRGLTVRCRRNDGTEHVVSLAEVVFGQKTDGARYVAAYRKWLGLEPFPQAVLRLSQRSRRHKARSKIPAPAMKPRTTIGSAPWITADGTADLAKFPIDSILKQTLSRGFEQFRSGCVILGSMADNGRAEAGVYLLGLLGYHASNLNRLEIVAEQLAYFRHAASAHALFSEIRRVKSSNTTRRYLDRVLRSLSHLPADLVSAGLQNLAEDPSFSYRMRAKFRQVFRADRM